MQDASQAMKEYTRTHHETNEQGSNGAPGSAKQAVCCQRRNRIVGTILLVLLGLVACVSIVANLAKWMVDYVLPMFAHPHFFEDFGLFRGLGERAICQPNDLYGSESIGTWVEALGARVFHMYSPVAALFFIPLFLVPEAIGYATMSALSYFVGLLACWLYLQTCGREKCCGRPTTWIVLLVTMGGAPLFQDMYMGNVSALTLLCCIMFIYLLGKRHPVLAGVVLGFGFWLKLYPVFLGFLLWNRKDALKCATSFGLAVCALLALSVVWIPFSQHVRFFFEILPAYSKQTTLHSLNQSIHAVFMRGLMGPKSYCSWNNVLMPLGVRLCAWSVGGMWVVIALLLSRRTSLQAIHGAAAVLTGVVALITPVGWGHTYVLILPAFLFCLSDAELNGHLWRWIVPVLAFGAFLVPAWWVPDYLLQHPVWAFALLNRYAWAGLALMMQTVVVAWNGK